MGTETKFCPTLPSINQKTAHMQRFACVSITGTMHSTPTADLEAILMLPPLGIYNEGEATQATYRLNCAGEFTRARFSHSEVFEKITKKKKNISSGPKGQDCYYYCFSKKVFS
jgi:hypothetical protein